MHRAAVFVDAGYVFAQGSVLLTGTKQGREYLGLDIPNVVGALRQVALERTGVPLLRTYWYDAMRLGRPTPEQMALADAADIKIRLGQVNAAGEQKGVDALIITDLAELARNRAMTDAILVSGDEDVRVGVVLAQQFGVRVHLVGIQPSRANQSRPLVQEADTATEWDAKVIGGFLAYRPSRSGADPAPAKTEADLDILTGVIVEALPPSDLAALQQHFSSGDRRVSPEHDRVLLRTGRRYHATQTLSHAEQDALRSAFVRLVQTRPTPE